MFVEKKSEYVYKHILLFTKYFNHIGSVLSLILQHVSNSEGHLRASSVKYIKVIAYSLMKLKYFYSCIKFLLFISQ